jgi:uncharacterized membrane protein
MLEVTQDNNTAVIRLMPNRSASWYETKWLIAAFALFISTIAIAWAVVGAWVILPFAGIEVLLLALLMHYVSSLTYQWETVEINTNTVIITSSTSNAQTLRRDSTYVDYTNEPDSWLLPKTILYDGEHTVEVGHFLNESDRDLLKQSLKNAGLIVCQRQWWKS